MRLTIDTQLQIAAQNALPVRDPARAQQRPVGGRRRRDRGAEPEGRLDPRDGVLAVVRPVGLQRTRDHARKLAMRRGSTPRHRHWPRNYPALDRALDGTYPPGSTFKPLTAIAALAGASDQAVRLLPLHGLRTSLLRTLRTTSSTTGTASSTRGWTCRRRSRSRATRTSTASATSSTCCRDRGQPIQRWARRSGSGGRAAPTSPRRRGARADDRLAAPHVHEATDPTNWQVDRLWKPGDSISSRSARRTSP